MHVVALSMKPCSSWHRAATLPSLYRHAWQSRLGWPLLPSAAAGGGGGRVPCTMPRSGELDAIYESFWLRYAGDQPAWRWQQPAAAEDSPTCQAAARPLTRTTRTAGQCWDV